MRTTIDRRRGAAWPTWLRVLNVGAWVLTAIVVGRLVFREVGFDVWTHAWVAYVCSFVILRDRWLRGREESGGGEPDGARWMW